MSQTVDFLREKKKIMQIGIPLSERQRVWNPLHDFLLKRLENLGKVNRHVFYVWAFPFTGTQYSDLYSGELGSPGIYTSSSVVPACSKSTEGNHSEYIL